MILTFLQAALPIFALRVMDMSLYTMRITMVVRGRKILAWIFAFCQSFVFVYAIRAVFSDLGNWGKIFGYVTGFATGLVVGMLIEERMAVGITHLRIISARRGAEITERLRSQGYAVTEIPARGKDGVVTLLYCSVLRKDSGRVQQVVTSIDPDAFIITEAVRSVQRGFWHK